MGYVCNDPRCAAAREIHRLQRENAALQAQVERANDSAHQQGVAHSALVLAHVQLVARLTGGGSAADAPLLASAAICSGHQETSAKKPEASAKEPEASAGKPEASAAQRANIAEQRADIAEQRAEGAEQRLKSAEQRAETAEQRADSAEQNAKRIEQRANTTEQKASRTLAAGLAMAAEAAGKETTAAHARAAAADKKAADANAEAAAANSRAAAAELEATAAGRKADIADLRAAAAKLEATAAGEKVAIAEQRAVDFEHGYKAAALKADAAEQRAKAAHATGTANSAVATRKAAAEQTAALAAEAQRAKAFKAQLDVAKKQLAATDDKIIAVQARLSESEVQLSKQQKQHQKQLATLGQQLAALRQQQQCNRQAQEERVGPSGLEEPGAALDMCLNAGLTMGPDAGLKHRKKHNRKKNKNRGGAAVPPPPPPPPPDADEQAQRAVDSSNAGCTPASDARHHHHQPHAPASAASGTGASAGAGAATTGGATGAHRQNGQRPYLRPNGVSCVMYGARARMSQLANAADAVLNGLLSADLACKNAQLEQQVRDTRAQLSVQAHNVADMAKSRAETLEDCATMAAVLRTCHDITEGGEEDKPAFEQIHASIKVGQQAAARSGSTWTRVNEVTNEASRLDAAHTCAALAHLDSLVGAHVLSAGEPACDAPSAARQCAHGVQEQHLHLIDIADAFCAHCASTNDELGALVARMRARFSDGTLRSTLQWLGLAMRFFVAHCSAGAAPPSKQAQRGTSTASSPAPHAETPARARVVEQELVHKVQQVRQLTERLAAMRKSMGVIVAAWQVSRKAPSDPEVPAHGGDVTAFALCRVLSQSISAIRTVRPDRHDGICSIDGPDAISRGLGRAWFVEWMLGRVDHTLTALVTEVLCTREHLGAVQQRADALAMQLEARSTVEDVLMVRLNHERDTLTAEISRLDTENSKLVERVNRLTSAVAAVHCT